MHEPACISLVPRPSLDPVTASDQKLELGKVWERGWLAYLERLRAMTSPAVNVICPDAGVFVDPRMPPPTEEQVCY